MWRSWMCLVCVLRLPSDCVCLQACQVSRIQCENHAFEFCLTLSRNTSYSHALWMFGGKWIIYYSYFFLSFFVFIGYRQRSSVSHLRIAAKVALVFASFCCATQEDRQRERGSWCQWHQRFYKQDATLRFRFIQGWKMLHIPPSCMTCQSTTTHWQTNSLFWDFFSL